MLKISTIEIVIVDFVQLRKLLGTLFEPLIDRCTPRGGNMKKEYNSCGIILVRE
jgi:hypothetical protein